MCYLEHSGESEKSFLSGWQKKDPSSIIKVHIEENKIPNGSITTLKSHSKSQKSQSLKFNKNFTQKLKSKVTKNSQINLGKLNKIKYNPGQPIQHQDDHFRLTLNSDSKKLVLKSYEIDDRLQESNRYSSQKVGEHSISELIKRRVYNYKTGQSVMSSKMEKENPQQTEKSKTKDIKKSNFKDSKQSIDKEVPEMQKRKDKKKRPVKSNSPRFRSQKVFKRPASAAITKPKRASIRPNSRIPRQYSAPAKRFYHLKRPVSSNQQVKQDPSLKSIFTITNIKKDRKLLKRTRSNAIIHSCDYDYEQYYKYDRKTDAPFQYVEDSETLQLHNQQRQHLTQSEKITLSQHKTLNKLKLIINDGERMNSMKHFLKEIHYWDKSAKPRIPSARASKRYGNTISIAISNSENVNKSTKDFVQWLRNQDHSYLSNPHIRYQRSKIPQHFNIQKKDISSSHPYSPLSKMNYYPINPMYALPLQENFFKKVSHAAYKNLEKELNNVQSNKPCNFKNMLYFKDKMKRGRIGLHVKEQNRPWSSGVGRLKSGMKSQYCIKGSRKGWKERFMKN